MDSQVTLEVLATAIKSARESQDLSMRDLAGRCCLSDKHILQIEEGGDSCFYSRHHKLQVAKKIASFLNISIESFQVKEDRTDESESTGEIQKPEKPEKIVFLPNPSNKEPIQDFLKIDNKQHNKTLAYALLQAVGFITGGLAISAAYMSYAEIPFELSLKNLTNVGRSDHSIPAPAPVQENLITTSSVLPEDLPKPVPKDVCQLIPESVPVSSPTNVISAGNFVHFIAKANKQVCVKDAKGLQQLVSLQAGDRKTVLGVAPWTVLSEDFSNVELYFQGRRVWPSSSTTHTVRLQEVILINATTPNPTSGEGSNSNQ